MDEAGLARVMDRQDGVVSRRQVLEAGGDDNVIEAAVRGRRWVRLHGGVYLDHTGVPTWRQRAWAAVLYHWPAALAGRSALVAHGMAAPVEGEVIELVVHESRRVVDPPGVRTRRSSTYDQLVLSQLSPPRVRIEHAALTVAARATTDDAAVATLADACQRRRTTPARLRDALGAMSRCTRRGLMLEILDDVASGAFSALERRYLRDVERAHGLPTGRRQRREVVDGGSVVVYRDVEYPDQTTLVELDGRLGHEFAADRWADLTRDLLAAATGRMALRVGWHQALQPCRLAQLIAQVLRSRGWRGELRPCGASCTAAPGAGDIGVLPAPDAGGTPMSAA